MHSFLTFLVLFPELESLPSAFEYFVFNPFFGSFKSLNYVVFLHVEESRPIFLPPESVCVAHNDKPMLGSGQGDIDSAVVPDEATWFGPDHRHKDKIKFSPLRAVDGEDLIFNTMLSKFHCNQILLCVVWSDYV